MENVYKVAATGTLVAGAVFSSFAPSLAATVTSEPAVAEVTASTNDLAIELPTHVTGTDYATAWFAAESDAAVVAA